MRQLVLSVAALAASLALAGAQTPQARPAPLSPGDLIKKIQGEVLTPTTPPEEVPDHSVPHGSTVVGSIYDTEFFPGTRNDFQVYVPAQYDPAKPACLVVKMDGLSDAVATTLDHLIANQEVPVIIAVGISPGDLHLGTGGGPVMRADRCFQYDSMNDRFPEFLITRLLPQVETMKTPDGRPIHLSQNPDDRMMMGASSGGICSFNVAWRRPDQFHRVFSSIGTFVAMRGGNEFPALIRKTEPKPLRVFLEDGSQDAWNLNLGSWFEANTAMESALTFAGYDVAHAWGTHGHDGGVGEKVFPDVMRWMWRDYPAPIKAGTSQNDKLGEILAPGEGWVNTDDKLIANITSLAANPKGEVFSTESKWFQVFKEGSLHITQAGTLAGAGTQGLAFGPDGAAYIALPTEKRVMVMQPDEPIRQYASGIAAHSLIVTHDGTIYASEPGEHPDMPSTIWRIKPDGTKEKINEGLHAASGIAFTPDHGLFYAAENTTKWVYNWMVAPEGTFSGKSQLDWLHITDIENDSGAEDLAVDTHGNLYVATRLGVQVCDQNGRVRAILPLPTPSAGVRSLTFGGPAFDELYVTDGHQVWKRKMKLSGWLQWMAPTSYPNQGGG